MHKKEKEPFSGWTLYLTVLCSDMISEGQNSLTRRGAIAKQGCSKLVSVANISMQQWRSY
jgi:hypothetical protein